MTVALHVPKIVKYRDKRTGLVREKRVTVNSAEAALKALGKFRGGEQNVEILAFDGVELEEAHRPKANGEPAQMKDSHPTVVIPTRQQVEEAAPEQLRQMVVYLRKTAVHAEYYDLVPLKWRPDQIRDAILNRHHPADGKPHELPEA